MKILITGASGFVGQRLTKHLELKGHSVIACNRELVPNIENFDWKLLLQGVEAVVHLAARVHMMNENSKDPLSTYRKTNVEATRRLAETCVAAGVKRFIFLSSIKVNGEKTTDQPFTENDAAAPEDPYGISKMEAEKVLVEIADRTDLEVVILRPPLVYGPGVKANFLSLMSAIQKSRPLPVGSIRNNKRSLVFVENLVSAIEKVLVTPGLKKEIYLVADDVALSTFELCSILKKSFRSKSALLPIPLLFLKLTGMVLNKQNLIDKLTGSLVVDNSKIKKALRWSPPFSSEAGIQETANSYRG